MNCEEQKVFSSILWHIWVKQITEKEKIVGWGLGFVIGCWLDGGRSEYELATDCKKEARFKQTKWLEKSKMHHQSL